MCTLEHASGTLPNLNLKDSLATLEHRAVDNDDGAMNLLCGVPSMSTRKKPIVKKRMEIVTAPPTPPEFELGDEPNPSPQQPAWTHFFTCSPPRCDGGDDNADYFISSSGMQGEEPVDDEDGYIEEAKDEDEIDPESSFTSDWDQGSVSPEPVKIFYTEDAEVAVPGNPKAAGMKPPSNGESEAPPKAAKVVSTRCKSCAVM